MKAFVLSICLFLFSIVTFAQRYHAGHIIRNGQKTNGWIRYNPVKDISKNNSILFKESKTGVATKLTAEEVQRFRLEDVKADFIAVKNQALDKIVFTEIIQDGPVILSSQGKFYALTKKSGEVLNLYLPVTDKFLQDTKSEGINKKVAELKSIGLLKNFLEECEKVTFTQYTIDNLNRAVSNYNRCKGVSTSAPKGKVEFGILAGYQLPSIKFGDSRFNYFSGKATPQLGLNFDFKPRRFSDRIALNVQIIYRQNKYELDKNSPLGSLDINLDHTTVGVPISIRAFMVPGAEGFFVAPGIDPVFITGTDTKTSLVKFQSFAAGVFAGVGYKKSLNSGHSISANLRYETSIKSYLTNGSMQSNLQFMVGFTF